MEWESKTVAAAEVLLARYGEAIAQDGDVGGCYADPVYFGGPAGGQLVPAAPFLAALPRLREVRKQLGIVSTTATQIKVTALNATHARAEVEWEALVRTSSGVETAFRVWSTYLLAGPTWRITAQIDHDDLMARAKALVSEEF